MMKKVKINNLQDAKQDTLIFQLSTNNWQTPEEAAPGSGILCAAHHQAFNDGIIGVKSYTAYPSPIQKDDPNDNTFKVIQLHGKNIPIAESAGPVSKRRWHGMSDEEIDAHNKNIEQIVFDYMNEVEEKYEKGNHFKILIGHHAFWNNIILKNVNERRVKELGKPRAKIISFVHGTVCKMYENELDSKQDEEYPLRFYPIVQKSNVFNDVETGVNAVFVISKQQRDLFTKLFPEFPGDRIIVSPNGVNPLIFHPRDQTLQEVLKDYKDKPQIPENAKIDYENIDKLIVYCGRYADWKRIDALVVAAKKYEQEMPRVGTIIIGHGPDDAIKHYSDLMKQSGLKKTYFLTHLDQNELAAFFTVANTGCFPSYQEPFGMVLVETMMCGTPVIAMNSGGPKDIVSKDVGTLVDEPKEVYDFETLGESLYIEIKKSLDEDHKSSKSEACVKLANEKYGVTKQCKEMLENLFDIVQV